MQTIVLVFHHELFVMMMSYQKQQMIFMFFSKSEDDINDRESREQETQYYGVEYDEMMNYQLDQEEN